MSFASIIRDNTGTGSLIRLIEDGFQRNEVKPPLNPQRDYLRASGIPSMCPREEVLCAMHGIQRPDTVDAGLNVTFLHGTSLHWGVQNVLLGPLGVLYGAWRCDECAFIHGEQNSNKRFEEWAVKRPDICEFDGCKSRAFTYVEASFRNDSLRLTGHSDGFLVLPGLPGMGILEVKSVGQKSAREIEQAPQIGHIVQAHVYMMFTGFKWGKILYWKKGDFGMKALVEHHVERDEEMIENIRASVQSVWSGIQSKELPERICANDGCPRARACAAVCQCFPA